MAPIIVAKPTAARLISRTMLESARLPVTHAHFRYTLNTCLASAADYEGHQA